MLKMNRRRTRRIRGTGLACIATVVLSLQASAMAQGGGGDNKAVIKYRQNVMSVMGGATGVIVGRLRDGYEYGPKIPAMAQALQAASRDIPALFPKGSGQGDTWALPAVWEDRQGFEKAASQLADKVDAFAKVADSGDRAKMLRAFKEVGDACSNCHDDYRKED